MPDLILNGTFNTGPRSRRCGSRRLGNGARYRTTKSLEVHYEHRKAIRYLGPAQPVSTAAASEHDATAALHDRADWEQRCFLERGIANFLRFLRPDPCHRPLLAWALASPRPAFQYAALHGFMALDQGHLEPTVIERFRASEEPLLRLVALGAASRDGDPEAIEELGQAAHEAPHVVLRAQALRGLRTSAPRPAGYLDLCSRSLKRDKEVYDLYYAPATSEAALGLARHDATPESTALEALVDAALDLTNDEAHWAIESSICSWLDHSEAAINPIWYWTYLFPAHRNDPPREAS